ncbi:MAG: deoxyribodipyrimidine photo-lyase [Flavobacteriales bacterium]|nr:deoxyribodipyrimidine photo-lyase [Flavobacteriales bacterium]
MKVSIHWFRRDLRLDDNHGLYKALESDHPTIPLFIFDSDILEELPEDDARVTFIHQQLSDMHAQLLEKGSGMVIQHGKPLEIWKKLIKGYDIAEVHTNGDYEPYALQRDESIQKLLAQHDIPFHMHKDQVIFEKDEVVKDDGDPYTVYTPYSKKWLSQLEESMLEPHWSSKNMHRYHEFKKRPDLPSLADIGFKESAIKVPAYDIDEELISTYDKTRNLPAMSGTSKIGAHLRFGTISVRKAFKRTYEVNMTYAKELIWREFFMQILYHFPHVVEHNFRRKYDAVKWRNNEEEFEKWCKGETGYPFVDAGMRELNETGFMHNRVRMITAGFLTKHLLIDWRWGEAYFAEKLLDYDLSSNNGNWQWAAGTGCDAAPYFRVFNPTTQIDKFDKDRKYIRQWVPEFESDDYPEPMVEHKMARERALDTYKTALN